MDSNLIQSSPNRWLVLFLFACFSGSNAYQWIQYAIIPRELQEIYSINQQTLDWFSIIYMLVYIPFIIPATWALDRFSLRTMCCIGAIGNAVGAIIKYLSIKFCTNFWLAFTGQTIAAISQVYVLTIPPALAGAWFPANEVSTACSLGVFANQFGTAVGFLVPPLFTNSSETYNSVTNETSYVQEGEIESLQVLFGFGAVFTVFTAVAMLVLFKSAPEFPPSSANQMKRKEKIDDLGLFESFSFHFSAILRLFKNRNITLLILSYGLNTGVYYAVGTLLGAFVIKYYGVGDEGFIGLTLIISGLFGAVLAGYWLDKTKTYKLTMRAMYAFSLASMIFYTVAPYSGEVYVLYVAGGCLGLTMTGYLPVGFELGVEMSYPETESSSSGLLNASAQFFGVIFTIGLGQLMGDEESDRSLTLLANLIGCGGLVLGLIFTFLIKVDLKRQDLENAQMHEVGCKEEVVE